MVNNTLVKRLTSLRVDAMITKRILEKQLAVKEKVFRKQQFLQNHFLQDDHHGFSEDVEVTLFDKT